MTTYGVTPQGFVAKPQEVIVQEFVDGQTSLIDPAMNTGAATPLGQLNGIVGGALAELWEVAQACYNGLNRDDAEGPALDNIGELTGDTRETPGPSTVTCQCTLTLANSPYPAGTLVCNVNGDNTRQFSNVFSVTVFADGTVPVLMASLANGPVEANAGSLTVITAPVSGWSAVTNPLDATPGHLLQGDPQYRESQREEVAAAGASTVDAIRANLEQIRGVVAVTVLENTTDVTDPVTYLPPHSVQAIVWDGTPDGSGVDGAVIGQAIWDQKPSGVATYGGTSAGVLDASGRPQTVRYSRTAEHPVYLAFKVTLGPRGVLGTVGPLLAQTVVYLSRGFQADGTTPLDIDAPGKLVPGETVYALLYRAAALAVPGVLDVPQMALDFSSSPTATANLLVAQTDIAVLDTSRITVVLA